MFQWLKSGIKRAVKWAGVPLRDPALVSLFGKRETESGTVVDEVTALNFSAVWAAVRVLSESLASLPVTILKTTLADADERTELIDHPLQYTLNVAPNDRMSAFVFHETLQAHVLTWGNAFARIVGKGGKRTLWPMAPDQVRIGEDASGNVVYTFDGRKTGEESVALRASEVVHIPGLSFDGLRGYSVISMAAESIGLGMAAEKQGAGFFGRGATPSGIITHPQELTEQARKNLRASWDAIHRGPANSHRVAILDEGMTFSPITMSAKDSEYLATRLFQVVEIARWFNLPPHMLRDLTHATYSNIEHQTIDFLVYSLRPWLIRWKQEYIRKMFTFEEQHSLTLEHDTTALLQTDTAARFAAFRTAREGGWYTINNILRKLGMNTIGPEGDTYLQPLNMETLGRPVAIDVASLDSVATFIQGRGLSVEVAAKLIGATLPQADVELVQSLASEITSARATGE